MSRHLLLATLLLAASTAASLPSARAEGQEQVATSTVTTSITVKGMTCGGCEKALNKKVSALKGVTSCKADHKAGTAEVTFDPGVVDAATIAKTINTLGFTATTN